MIAARVASEAEVEARLRALGFEPTTWTTDTGTFWRSKSTGKHILVPFSVQGFYPNWLLGDLVEIIGKISPGGTFH